MAGAALWYLVAHPVALQAQCVMCYLSASASGDRGSQALRWGILVLAIPTLLIFAGLFILAYRRRHPVEQEDFSSSTQRPFAERPPLLPTHPRN